MDDLKGWAFRLDIEVFGSVVSLTRSVDEPKRIAVTGDTAAWPLQPTWDEKAGQFFAVQQLSWQPCFPKTCSVLGNDDAAGKYSPTLGSLLGYFMRRTTAAYADPFKHYPNQHEWDKQVNIGFLLGLHWQDAAAWQQLKDEKKRLDQLERASKDGPLGAAGKRGCA